MKNYTVQHWHIVASVLIAGGSILAVLGFNSPAEAIASLKKAELETTKRIEAHEVELATIRVKLDYIAKGVDELRGKRGP